MKLFLQKKIWQKIIILYYYFSPDVAFFLPSLPFSFFIFIFIHIFQQSSPCCRHHHPLPANCLLDLVLQQSLLMPPPFLPIAFSSLPAIAPSFMEDGSKWFLSSFDRQHSIFVPNLEQRNILRSRKFISDLELEQKFVPSFKLLDIL